MKINNIFVHFIIEHVLPKKFYLATFDLNLFLYIFNIQYFIDLFASCIQFDYLILFLSYNVIHVFQCL